MKKIIAGIVWILGVFTTISAQESKTSISDRPTKNISVEILGPSNLIGVHYDARFKGNKGWGYSIGAGWGFSQSSDIFNNLDRFNSISLIPRINYLIGRKNHKLELGFGTNIGYVFGKEEYNTYKKVGAKDGVTQWEVDKHVKEHHQFLGYYFFCNIGYRRQALHGFVFRAGVSPAFGFGGSHSIDKLYILPYISFGKSF
ncbi:MAG: hypothetical protein ACTTJK_03175 [Phocaeicola sp.]|uniref:hypothetical protein n=1 Tax=Phocaeicola sp. TaxID=2773926 RepID=UPI003F9F884C